MSKMQSLTAENLEDNRRTDLSVKRPSIHIKENSDGGPNAVTTNPSLRRLSRLEGRASVQYRRMSQVSRSSVTGSSILGSSIFLAKNVGLYPVKLQNTYQLEPHLNQKFKSGPVQVMIQEVLDEYLNGEKYNATQCRNLVQMLTDHIKTRVKDMGFHRYKYIVTVTIGQDCNQGVHVVSRCLWNKDTDNFAEARYNKNGLYAVAAVYACYFE